jgi:capsid assembly protease
MATFLPHIAGQIFNKPLLLTHSYAEVLVSAISDRLDVAPLVPQATLEANYRPSRSLHFYKNDAVSVVPIVGGLTHRAGYEAMSGSVGYTGLQAELAAQVAQGARGLVLDWDSPGGAVSGLAETSKYLNALRASGVTIYSVVNDLCASAAYWLAACSDRVYSTEYGTTGSIGVVTMHVDRSGEMEKAGRVLTFIHAGAKKVEGNQFQPLAEETRAAIQAQIDTLYGRFVDHVASARSIHPEKVRATEAATFGPEAARDIGLIDGIASLDEVTDAMKMRLNGPRVRGASFPAPSTNTGASAVMADNLIYTQADLDTAVSKAVENAKASTASAVAEAMETGAAKALDALTAAMSGLFKGDARAESFVELIADGMSPEKAAKHAAKLAPAPAASGRDEDIAKVFAAAAPKVADSGDPEAPAPAPNGNSPKAPDKEAFLASLGLKAGAKLAAGAMLKS